MSPSTAVTYLWVIWYVTWLAAVVFSGKTTVQMRSDMSGWHRMIGSLGFILMFVPVATPGSSFHPELIRGLASPLWSEPVPVGWGLFALVVMGFAFCWWARLHLGRLWSGFVTLKEDHHIVDTGPYGLVRHPIYSGVMFASLVTALMKTTPAALLGFALVTLGFGWVAKVEEQFLREQLGKLGYDEYSRRVAMLVPGLKKR